MNEFLKYKGYSAQIQFSAEDDVFYGQILGINELVNFQGDSVKSLKKAFEEAVDDYLDTGKCFEKLP